MTTITGTNDRTATTASGRRPRRHLVGTVLRRGAPWRSLGAFCLIGVVATAFGPASSGLLRGAETVAVAHSVGLAEVWGRRLNDGGGPIALSSPNVANLAGGPAVVVGDRAGHVYAFNLATGNDVPGWPVSTGGVPVDSHAVGAGHRDRPRLGLRRRGQRGHADPGRVHGDQPDRGHASGSTTCRTRRPTGRPGSAVQASMAVGNLQGGTDVVAGSLGEVDPGHERRPTAPCCGGFPWFQADSNFTTPALADLYSNGRTEIVEGGDSTRRVRLRDDLQQRWPPARASAPRATPCTGNPSGGLVCEYNTDQTVQSSPAVGEFLAGGGVGIAFGTGATYGGASTTNDLIAVNTHCGARGSPSSTAPPPAARPWPTCWATASSRCSKARSERRTMWALNGSNGRRHLAHRGRPARSIGSVVTADLSGGGYQDVIVPTTAGRADLRRQDRRRSWPPSATA